MIIMFIEQMQRGSGKTFRCISLCVSEGYILVCPTLKQVKLAKQYAIIKFGKEIKAISIEQYINGDNKSRNKFVIDELSLCFKNVVYASNTPV